MTMRRIWMAGMALLVLALTLPMCTGVPLTAPSNADVTLQANPTSIPANGGVSVITAIVTEAAGTPAPNGTTIFFVTDLGRVDTEAKTKDGVARVNLVSDSRSGTANVTGFSGGPAAAPGPSASPTATPGPTVRLSLGLGTALAGPNTDTIQVKIGSTLPAKVIVTSNPARITSPRSALVTANVFDGSGNPVANVPVFFAITDVSTGPPIPTTTTTTTSTTSSTTTTTTLPVPPAGLEETLDSGGTPQYTDRNGQAFDWLRTRSLPTGLQKTVTVTATTSNGVSATVDVFIN
jgi:hypothetical protein